MWRLRKYLYRIRRVFLREAYVKARKAPLQRDWILYESFAGNGVLCNPEAIFRELLADPSFSHLHHVWAVNKPRRARKLHREAVATGRVTFVKRMSREYFKRLATLGYLVNNATFPVDFVKRPGQIYINTWHGTPLKLMGYETSTGGSRSLSAQNSGNVVRNFMAADYLVSSGPFMTEAMYVRSYQLTNLFSGRIIEEGQPRTDLQFARDGAQRARRDIHAAGIDVGQRKIAIYAPTWRGESFYDPKVSVDEVLAAVGAIQSGLGDDWVVLAKVHQVVFDDAVKSRELRPRLVPNDVSTNEVLAAADMLVTDYSSIFFDYLSLNRPIVYYVPDLADYDHSRGFYVDSEQLPGVQVTTLSDLTAAVAKEATQPDSRYEQMRAEWTATYAPYDDGLVSRRVIDVIFNKNDDRRTVDISSDGRERILIYMGDMRLNGITASGMSLLSNIDYDRFDVSAYYLASRDVNAPANVDALPDEVRLIPRVGAIAVSRSERKVLQALQQGGLPTSVKTVDEIPERQMFVDEWRRCFGDVHFDRVLDFSGYAIFWNLIFLQAPTEFRAIWLHNEMAADAQREVLGKRHLQEKLQSVFTTYRFFDSLVSVSEELNRVNSRDLAWAAAPERFSFSRNTINADRIRTMAARPLTGPVVEWISTQKSAGHVIFVAVGRLSTEKNHERLLRAFARVSSENPNIRLVIIGGGPLESHLRSLTVELGLAERVLLTGLQKNPFALLEMCDCFVLSSDYEGQPMVILEALTLGLPVVVTNFASARDAMPPDVGLVVEPSVDGVEQGLRAFLQGSVPNGSFDPAAYNATTMKQFYRAIGVEYAPAANDEGDV